MQVYLGNQIINQSYIGNIAIEKVANRYEFIDPNVKEFVSVTGITDPNTINSLDTLAYGMKQAGIWDKMYIVYPFVGGTETTNKYNLINPQDTNAAHRIVFTGGWTYDSNGITGNGTNTSGNTNFQAGAAANAAFTASASIGVYSRTAGASKYDLGARNTSGRQYGIIVKYDVNNSFYPGLQISSAIYSGSISGTGLYSATRNGTSVVGYINDTNVVAGSGTWSTIGQPLNIGGLRNDEEIANRNYAFIYVGNYLTNTEMQNYYTLIQNFQTALGRAV